MIMARQSDSLSAACIVHLVLSFNIDFNIDTHDNAPMQHSKSTIVAFECGKNLHVAAENYTCEPKCFVFFIARQVRLQLSGQGLTQHEK